MTKILDLFFPPQHRRDDIFSPEMERELQSLADYQAYNGGDINCESDSSVLRKALYEADIIITGWGAPLLPVDLKEKGKLSYVCSISGGVRANVPRVLLEHGLLVSNWGSAISRTIAEATLMMILGCLRRIRPTQEVIHNRGGYWSVPDPQSLFERKVGLFGFGAIARALVPLLRPFDVEIYAYDPYLPEHVFEKYGVKPVASLESLFSTCDIISLHAAKTLQTNGVINQDILRLLPEDGVLVNTSRGACLNEAHLAAELNSGRLWAALDVYNQEPIPQDSPLRGSERLLLFPHKAGPTKDRRIDMGRFALANLRRYLAGEPVEAVVTLAQFALMT